jgi:hypothetical protein
MFHECDRRGISIADSVDIIFATVLNVIGQVVSNPQYDRSILELFASKLVLLRSGIKAGNISPVAGTA